MGLSTKRCLGILPGLDLSVPGTCCIQRGVFSMSDLTPSVPAPRGEFLLYQTEDGRTRLQVRIEAETVWLSLNQMADLFQRDKSVISRHIANVFDEGELRREATVAKSATVQAHPGFRRSGEF